MPDQIQPPETIYDRLGLRPLINACGPSTRLSGGVMRPEVAEAMAEAAQACIDVAALQEAAGRQIAAATGAEAGYVTPGAAAGLMIGAAACVTGSDPALINRLPDTTGLRNEAVIARSQRNMYDHAVSQVGLRFVEVGIPDRYAGAGVRDAQAWEYAAAITDRTALVLWVANAASEPSLQAVTEVAHARGVPVLVDAAAQLPPASNLKRFIIEGADLVVYSGGKAIGGPQASGMLAGRRDLIQAAALNHLDHDVDFAQWSPPAGLIDKASLKGLPASGIGRAAKIGKEQIVGLMTALRLFLEDDPEARRALWRARCEELMQAFAGIAHVQARIVEGEVPMVEMALDRHAGLTARELAKRLQDGNPGVAIHGGKLRQGLLVFGPSCLRPGEPALVGLALRNALGAN